MLDTTMAGIGEIWDFNALFTVAGLRRIKVSTAGAFRPRSGSRCLTHWTARPPRRAGCPSPITRFVVLGAPQALLGFHREACWWIMRRRRTDPVRPCICLVTFFSNTNGGLERETRVHVLGTG